MASNSTMSITPNISMEDKGTIGITIIPASTLYEHKVTISLGDYYSQINFTVGDYSNVFSIPESWWNAISSSANAKATLTTYSGTTVVGNPITVQFAITLPDYKPTIDSLNVTFYNSNSVVRGWNICLQNYSEMTIDCKASGKYGSQISTYTYTGCYTGVKTSPGQFKILSFSSGYFGTQNCIVTDTRGKISEWKSVGGIEVHPYYTPIISSFSVKRNASTPNRANLTLSYSFASADGNNSVSATVFYKKQSEDSWTVYNGTIENESSLILNQDFDETSTYNFKVEVKDLLNNTATSETLMGTTQDVVFNIKENGKGFAFGKTAEKDETVEFAWDISLLETNKLKIGDSRVMPTDFIRVCGNSDNNISFSSNNLVPISVSSLGSQYSNSKHFEISSSSTQYPSIKGIKCLKSGFIELSACVHMTSQTNGTFFGCYPMICSSGAGVPEELTPGFNPATFSGAVSAPTQAIEVSAGDIIYLCCRASADVSGASYYLRKTTYLYLRYLEY